MSTISNCIKTTGDSKWKRGKKVSKYKSNKIQILELSIKEIKIETEERSSVGSNIILENNSNEDRRYDNVYNSSYSSGSNISGSLL